MSELVYEYVREEDLKLAEAQRKILEEKMAEKNG